MIGVNASTVQFSRPLLYAGIANHPVMIIRDSLPLTSEEKKQTTIKHKLIMDSNYDDVTLQPGDDAEFKNQFREFLQKNLNIL